MLKKKKYAILYGLGALLSLNAYGAFSQKTTINQNGEHFTVSTEDFSNTDGQPGNVGNWSYGNYYNQGLGFFESDNSQDSLLSINGYDYHHIVLATSGSSVFTGNYLAPESKVIKLSFQTRVVNINEGLRNRAVTLMLIGQNGLFLYKRLTDCHEINTMCKIPLPQNFVTFVFEIPKDAVSAKQQGWLVKNINNIDPTYKTQDYFETILKDVKQVQLAYQDPGNVHGFQTYNVDTTDISITRQDTTK